MKKCPICRGIVNANHQCQRCGADVAHLDNIEHQSLVLCRLALLALQQNNVQRAGVLMDQSLDLLTDDFKVVLRAFIDDVQSKSEIQSADVYKFCSP